MGRGRAPPPEAVTADAMRIGFEAKVDEVISSTTGFPPPASGCCLDSFSKVDVDLIATIIRHLPNKSSECDSMPISLLKENLDLLLPFLSKLFNSSLSLGIFPKCWKRTIVKPVIKKGRCDIFDVKSYRPISNLCVLKS